MHHSYSHTKLRQCPASSRGKAWSPSDSFVLVSSVRRFSAGAKPYRSVTFLGIRLLAEILAEKLYRGRMPHTDAEACRISLAKKIVRRKLLESTAQLRPSQAYVWQ
jgi:hypothetical protein